MSKRAGAAVQECTNGRIRLTVTDPEVIALNSDPSEYVVHVDFGDLDDLRTVRDALSAFIEFHKLRSG